MDGSILITYATQSGSTAEIAQAIGNELTSLGQHVEVRPIAEIIDVDGYQAVIVGGPMIFGWHSEAIGFLERHQQELCKMPVAYFLAGLSLTQSSDDFVEGVPVYQDPSLARPPRNPERLSYRENYARVSSYLRPVLLKTPQIRPASVAFFNGKLDSTRLNLISRLFVKLIIGAQDGDFRNWEGIRAWAASLIPMRVEKRLAA